MSCTQAQQNSMPGLEENLGGWPGLQKSLKTDLQHGIHSFEVWLSLCNSQQHLTKYKPLSHLKSSCIRQHVHTDRPRLGWPGFSLASFEVAGRKSQADIRFQPHPSGRSRPDMVIDPFPHREPQNPAPNLMPCPLPSPMLVSSQRLRSRCER